MWSYLCVSAALIVTWYLTNLYLKAYVLGIAIYGILLMLVMAGRKVYKLTHEPEIKDVPVVVVDNNPTIVADHDGLYQVVTVGSHDYSSFPTLAKQYKTVSFSVKFDNVKGKNKEERGLTGCRGVGNKVSNEQVLKFSLCIIFVKMIVWNYIYLDVF
jgi:hypothetical protein